MLTRRKNQCQNLTNINKTNKAIYSSRIKPLIQNPHRPNIMKTKSLLLIIATIVAFSCSSPKKETAAVQEEPKEEVKTEEKGVFFKSPKNGAKVSSPVFIEMGVKGMEIKPAGMIEEGVGHHHILINQTSWPEGDIIPSSDTTLHFGKGQKSTSLDLEPGTYTLSLQLANGVHQSYGDDWATSIEITVE